MYRAPFYGRPTPQTDFLPICAHGACWLQCRNNFAVANNLECFPFRDLVQNGPRLVVQLADIKH
jgi:hypothetical protein